MLDGGNNNKSTTSDGDVREKVQTETKYRWKLLKDLFIKCPTVVVVVAVAVVFVGVGRVA